MAIHPTAVIDTQAEIDPSADIGPFVVIEGKVFVGPRTRLGPGVHVQGECSIGADNDIGSHSTIGFPPQHLEYRGAPTKTVLGDRNRLREYVSIHRGYEEGATTVVGDDCFLMAYTHIAHDCRIGNRVIMAAPLIGGHVTVGDRAFISGCTGVHQFSRIGRLAMVGGHSRITQDVPPFMIVEGNPAYIRAINTVGITRAGFSAETRAELKRVYKAFYRQGKTVKAAIAELDLASLVPEARELADFYSGSKRGVIPFGHYHRPGRAEKSDGE